ncbi:uncharacterized protein LOC135344462 [Halichondria panicea]|uniref:uncharacterized protein LOC135344462 n=1 Tax=Halichondria panicea TaxID=6063 RepID=UPI00312B786C
MKTLLTVAVCAVLVAIAYSSPTVSKKMDINAIVENALEQALLLDSAIQSEEEEDTRDQTQDVFAVKQYNNAELQGWLKKIFKKAKKFVKKAVKVGKKVYNLYQKGKGCAEVEDMPEALEEAAIEVFMTHEKKSMLQSMQAKVAQTDEEDGGDELSAELQKFFASQQTQATTSWFKNLIRRGIDFGKKVYKGYKRMKNGDTCAPQSKCVQVQDLSEQLEDAVAEAMMIEDDSDTLNEAAFLQLLEE